MKTSLLLGVHSHQPVDNFDHVVLEATAKSYRPFFETLFAYPDFKFSAHYSGWLLEFIQKHDAPLFAMMCQMSERGQIEWFTGGFYEPVLASIPSADRKRQIQKLSDFIQTHFKQRPRGLWLTERVWDASIVGDLAELGIEYAMVDDYHLLCTGLARDAMNGWYVTENGGRKLGLFPISKALRYQVPFWEHATVIENIAQIDGAAVIFDDGEKFGVWPGTHDWVYEKGWLKAFVEGVLSSGTIQSLRYCDYADAHTPLGVVYPPDVSYYEMGEWSLRPHETLKLEQLKKQLENSGLADEAERFTRGATWKNFLVKYDESARIHRRMLALSARNPGNDAAFNEALMKAQCNDVLWHGIFGGLYLPSLRDTAWRYLIEAENRLNPAPGIALEDWNFDGRLEARLTSTSLIAGFEPKGGMLGELLLRNKGFNLLNTLARRAEAYHERIERAEECAQESGKIATIHDAKLKADASSLKHLVVDHHLRGGFIDHLVHAGFDLAGFFNQTYTETCPCPERFYRAAQENGTLTLRSENIQKNVRLEGNALCVATHLEPSPGYMQEHNFHFAEIGRVLINGRSALNEQVFEPANTLSIRDPWLGCDITLKADRPFETMVHPLYTVSQSEAGVDLTCQGVAVALFFGPLQSACEITVELSVEESQ
ncbi:MAG: alpha-amylase/4-alpha-glucanotransferase domain-containing protein [Campylobacterales bacterium]